MWHKLIMDPAIIQIYSTFSVKKHLAKPVVRWVIMWEFSLLTQVTKPVTRSVLGEVINWLPSPALPLGNTWNHFSPWLWWHRECPKCWTLTSHQHGWQKILHWRLHEVKTKFLSSIKHISVPYHYVRLHLFYTEQLTLYFRFYYTMYNVSRSKC